VQLKYQLSRIFFFISFGFWDWKDESFKLSNPKLHARRLLYVNASVQVQFISLHTCDTYVSVFLIFSLFMNQA